MRGTILLMALAVLLCGCTPAGPRALLKGKEYLDRGDVAGAVPQLKRATTLLATNASAWNYYGVALARAGQPEEAAAAYQNALKLDRDLLEAHLNFGTLSLEQNWTDLARAEFTTYTLRRPNDPTGWLRLGFAQMKAGENLQAERSFSTVRALKGDEAEVYNALGLARVQAGKPREAAQFFAAALQVRPNYPPARLNLAVVNQEYLHDDRAALANYQAYLGLAPRPANYNDVKLIAADLAQSQAPANSMAPPVMVKTSPPPESESKPATGVATSRSATLPHGEPEPRMRRPETSESRPSRGTLRTQSSAGPAETFPTQEVQVPPPQPIVTSPRANPASQPAVMAAQPAYRGPATAVTNHEPLEAPMPEEPSRGGFWRRVFGADKPQTASKRYREDTSAPIPGGTDEIAGTKSGEQSAEVPSTPGRAVAPPTERAQAIPRYAYSSPTKPAPGDRRAAEGAFTKARLAEQDENWAEAGQWYQSAAATDPSWFEAQYNAGVIAHRLHNYSVALPRYEEALAIRPDSVDARYNFSLALRSAGYPADAADELRKILASHPDDARAHLALANICAQSLHDVAQARQHYLRVLALEPDTPQASDIRFWLSANASK